LTRDTTSGIVILQGAARQGAARQGAARQGAARQGKARARLTIFSCEFSALGSVELEPIFAGENQWHLFQSKLPKN